MATFFADALRSLFSVLAVPVGHETLEGSDGYGLAFATEDAGTFALRLLWAHTSANGRQGRVFGYDVACLDEVALFDSRNEIGDADADGALAHAEWLLAVEAASGFGNGLFFGEAFGDFVEVVYSCLGVLFLRLLAFLVVFDLQLFFNGGGKVAAVAFLAGGDAVTGQVGLGKAFHSLVEINLMTVEFGTVDAGETHLAAHGDAAGAAHTRAVDHHRVERHDGGQRVLLGEQRDELHHRQGAYGHAAVVAVATLYELLDFVGDKAFLAITAVVGHYVEVVALCFHSVLKEQQAFVACAYNHIAAKTLLVRPLCLRIDRSGAHTSGDEQDARCGRLAEGIAVHYLGTVAKRSDNGEDAVAFTHRRQTLGRLAHNLIDDCHGVDRAVYVADCQRDTFAALVRDDDDKLARLSGFGDPRCLDVHQHDVLGELFFLQNLVHNAIVLWFILLYLLSLRRQKPPGAPSDCLRS